MIFTGNAIVIIDLSVIISMFVLASLSKRLGDALKIRKYYKLFYLSATLILFALLISLTITEITANKITLVLKFISLGMRIIGGILAIITCLPYWKWLFAEYFKK